jgi:hypothetical protein
MSRLLAAIPHFDESMRRRGRRSCHPLFDWTTPPGSEASLRSLEG